MALRRQKRHRAMGSKGVRRVRNLHEPQVGGIYPRTGALSTSGRPIQLPALREVIFR